MWFFFMILGASASVMGQLMTNTVSTPVNLPIPDNNIVGVSSTITLSSLIDTITDVNVSLRISGDFNGDLYAYLAHSSTAAVLLNRPGRTAMNTFGYPDGGFDVDFDDPAPNGDIHVYRLTLNPNGGVLTGTWSPDARNTDPAMTLDTDPRTRFLALFNGQNANGTWTLFVSDMSQAGTSTFQSWDLEVIGVPEPGIWVLMTLGGLGLFLAIRRAPRG